MQRKKEKKSVGRWFWIFLLAFIAFLINLQNFVAWRAFIKDSKTHRVFIKDVRD